MKGKAKFAVWTHQEWVVWVRTRGDPAHWGDWLCWVEARYDFTI